MNRIVHVVSLGPYDGYGLPGPCNVAVQQVNSLIAAGHDARILTTHAGFPSAQVGLVGAAPVLSYSRSQLFKGSLATIMSAGLFRGVTESVRSGDIIHFHASRDGIFLPLLMRYGSKTDIVVQTHGQIEADDRVSEYFDRIITARALSKAKVVIALQSVEAARLGRIGLDPNKIVIVKNRIEIGTDPPANRRLQVPITIAFVAHLRKRKRVDMAVRTSDELTRMGIAHRLVVAGPDGGDLHIVEDAVARNRSISYLGTLGHDQVVALLRSSDAFLFPADDEPFGMSFAEALAGGTPAICGPGIHAARGLSRGEGVVLCAENSPNTFASAVQDLVLSPPLWEELSRNGRTYARGYLDRDQYAHVLSELYEVGESH